MRQFVASVGDKILFDPNIIVLRSFVKAVWEKWICYMMDKSELANMILELAQGDGAKEIDDSTNIIADLSYDSLAMVEL